MKKIFHRTLLISFGVLFLSFHVHSQIRETGIIRGNVADKEGTALPGVSLTIESPNLIGGAQHHITDAKGSFRFFSLPIGVYKITADIQGFNTLVKEGIRLHANTTLTIDFTMTEAAITSEIVVEAVHPTIDIKSTNAATVVMTTEFLRSIPSAKTFAGLMNFAPGIQLTTVYGNNYNSSFGGGAGGQNAYLFDGIDVSSSSFGGYLLASPDMNTIEEASIEGLGLPAEYGNYTGTVISAITKSGSNKFSLFSEIRYNGKQWNAQNLENIPTERFLDPSDKEKTFQAGSFFDGSLQLGGKIVEDTLWFFISGQFNRTTNYPLGYPDTQRLVDSRAFLKLTYQLNPANRMNFSANYDKESIFNMWGRALISPEADVNRVRPGWVLNSSWVSTLSPNTLFDVKLGYNQKSHRDDPKQGEDLPGHYDYLTGMSTVNSGSFYRTQDKDLRGSAQLTHYVEDFLKGSHDFKFGAEVSYSRPSSLYGYCGGKWYGDYAGEPYLLYTQDVPVESNHKHNTTSLFARDTWTLTKNLTLNLGLRYDHYWYKIPTVGRGVVYNTGSFSPRVGFVLDLFGDQKTALKVHYGHYFEKIRQNQFYSADSGSVTYAYYQWDGAGWDEVYSSTPDPFRVQVDPDAKHPYVREITAGIQQELFKNASLSLTFYYRKMARFLSVVNMAARWQMVTIVNPGLDGVEGTADDMGTFDVYQRLNPGEDSLLITNPRKGQAESVIDDLKHTAKGIQIAFHKRFSNRWQLNASYHYTIVNGNTEEIDQGPGSGISPNAFINTYGRVGYFYGHPHQFKLQGSVVLPLDIMAGFSAEYISGSNKHPYIYKRLGPTTEFIYLEPPGKTKFEPRKNVDLRVEKAFEFEKVKFSLMADVYNVFNSDRVVLSVRQAGARWDKIQIVTPPRTYRIGFRFMF